MDSISIGVGAGRGTKTSHRKADLGDSGLLSFMDPRGGDPSRQPFWKRHFALAVAGAYIAVGLAWVLGTDSFVYESVRDPKYQHLAENLKGLFFIVATACFLFSLMRMMQAREAGVMAELQEAIAASRDGLWRWDVRNDRILATAGGDAELGWRAARFIKDQASWREIVHPDDWGQVDAALSALNEPGVDSWNLLQRFGTANGGWHWMEIKGRVVERGPDGSAVVMEGLYHSVDALKRAQEAAERTNGVLRILVAAYDVAATSLTSAHALNALVRRIAEFPNCPFAWVGEAMNDEHKRIVPQAWAGAAAEFVTSGDFRWDDSALADGPSGRAVKTKRPCFIEDAQLEAKGSPWLPALKKFGIHSGASIPIVTKSGQVYVLHIAGSAPRQFTSQDIDLFEMIARTLELIVNSADTAFMFTQSELARVEIAGRLTMALNGAISALATVIDKRDPYTAGHQHRVADLAVAIGTEMGLDPDRLEGLRIGAGIHDIGKIGVPTEILSKPGRLDEVEIALIKRHAEIGYQIVKNIDFGWPIEKIVRQHHERWDGSGYPSGLKGTDINLEARIVAVADVIESMGTNRPYRDKIPWDIVLTEIKSGRGIRYDPAVVDAALKILDGNEAQFGLG